MEPEELADDGGWEFSGHLQQGAVAVWARICHDTLPYGEHPELGESVCRGWYDRYGSRATAIQVFERLGGRFRMVQPIPKPDPDNSGNN